MGAAAMARSRPSVPTSPIGVIPSRDYRTAASPGKGVPSTPGNTEAGPEGVSGSGPASGKLCCAAAELDLLELLELLEAHARGRLLVSGLVRLRRRRLLRSHLLVCHLLVTSSDVRAPWGGKFVGGILLPGHRASR